MTDDLLTNKSLFGSTNTMERYITAIFTNQKNK